MTDLLTNFLGTLLVLFLFCFSMLVYMLPAIIALKNSHKQSDAIVVLDIFFGWTGIGWIVAFIWSLTK